MKCTEVSCGKTPLVVVEEIVQKRIDGPGNKKTNDVA